MLPPDLSPAQRAQIKAFRALIFLVGLNTGYAVGMFIFLQFGTPWNWGTFGLFALGQLLYAVLDIGEKYFSARGQMTISEIFEMGRQMGVRKGIGARDSTLGPIDDAVIRSIVKDEKPDEEPPQSSA